MMGDIVIGIGSPHGDDQAGWRLIDLLRQRGSCGAKLAIVNDPIDMLEHFSDVERLIVVDACRSGKPPGTIVKLTWSCDCRFDQSWESTHRISLIETLRLAQSLDRLPAEVVVYGIEIEHCLPGTGISASVNDGLQVVASRVRRELSMRRDNHSVTIDHQPVVPEAKPTQESSE